MLLASMSLHFEIQHLAQLAFHENLEWTAANFTICRESLNRDARIDDEVKSLPAEWALDRLRNFHTDLN